MTLTGAGRRLLPYAQRLAALAREAVLAAREDGDPKGPLAIGSMETTAAVRLPMPARRISPAFSGRAVEPADRDDSGSGCRRARRRTRRRFLSPVRSSMPTSRLPPPSRKSWCWSPRDGGKNLAALRVGTPESGPTALVFRTGCTYRQRLEQVLTGFGWPSAARFELGTLDGMIGCVAADMGVTLLPRAVVERHDQIGNIRIHALSAVQSRVDTLFIHRRSAQPYSALQGFVACLKKGSQVIAA